MRALARAAGASLSSTHYHFGTKEALLEAVLRRRVGPLNVLRLDRLATARAAAGDDPIPLESILAAYVGPFFETRAIHRERGTLQPWTAARLFFDPAPPVTRIRSELLSDVDARFLAELGRTVPHRSRREIEIAYRLTTGLLVHFSGGHVTRGGFPETDRADHEMAMQGLLDYAGAGLRSLEAGLEEESER
jgi:AcrR family transcriptional regulator